MGSRRNFTLTLPLSRQPFELSQYFLNILHAIGNTVGDGRRDGLLIVAEDKTCALQRSQPFGQHARGDSLDLPPKYSEAGWAVSAKHPQNVHRPGPRQQLQQASDCARGRDFSGTPRWSHIDTRLL